VKRLDVLVACEFSGVVRDAFLALGHNAISCDLLPTESPGPHIHGDVRDVLDRGWDMMIAHPSCQYLCNSGVRWLYCKDGSLDEERWQNMREAGEFFRLLLNAPIERICVENPIPHKHAQLPPYSQILHPHQHGHGESKATCLWLRGLPDLKPTAIVEGRKPRVHFESPGPDRWKRRSITYTGIGDAIARQYGGDVR